jgi:hypothetical protein
VVPRALRARPLGARLLAVAGEALDDARHLRRHRGAAAPPVAAPASRGGRAPRPCRPRTRAASRSRRTPPPRGWRAGTRAVRQRSRARVGELLRAECRVGRAADVGAARERDLVVERGMRRCRHASVVAYGEWVWTTAPASGCARRCRGAGATRSRACAAAAELPSASTKTRSSGCMVS